MQSGLDSITAIQVLVDLSRLLAEATVPDEVLARLADAAAGRLDVVAVVVIGVGDDGATRVLAARGLPPGVVGMTSPADDFDGLLVRRLIEAAEGRAGAARTYPLVSGGGLYGALLLLDRGGGDVDAVTEALEEGMANLAAVALDKAFHEAELRRALEELRQSREALLRAERLKALGEMAVVVAHEVRNPLAAMGGAMQILETRMAHTPADQKIVRMVLERLRGLNAMITEMLSYARPKELSLDSVDLLALAREVVEAAANDPSAAGVQLRHAGAAVLCRGDRDQLSRVVLNLVINAMQALAGRGSVEVSVSQAGSCCELAVVDDGPGVPEAIRGRIFEAFFTTRGGGTGLGLAIARGVVERHGGTLELLSPPEGGAVFRIRLPG
ncbi:hypothetical protein LBMAG42_12910 [Deltaproteobacteria bacterium]|nr:hypothetical protein LBMAG42_12910 [Deltaproteobacteria bacterium]